MRSARSRALALSSIPGAGAPNSQVTPDVPPGEDWARDLVGVVLDDRYRVDGLLGTGGMGAVYRAEQLTLGKPVAIKVLRPEYAHREIYVRRFLREARTASMIGHRNVVEVTDLGQADGGRVYLVMEYLQGEDLATLIRQRGRVGWARARRILLQTVRALKAAHAKGVIHRDIKPANIFLAKDDDGDFVKVLDFGTAKVANPLTDPSDALTSSHQMIGTAMYMAPEQALGKTVDARSDVYSLGAVAYQLLTGRAPFAGTTALDVLMRRINQPPPRLRLLVPELTASVEHLVQRAMARDPEDRFGTMGELEGALLAIDEDACREPMLLTEPVAAEAEDASNAAVGATPIAEVDAAVPTVRPRTERLSKAEASGTAARTPAPAPPSEQAGSNETFPSVEDLGPRMSVARRADESRDEPAADGDGDGDVDPGDDPQEAHAQDSASGTISVDERAAVEPMSEAANDDAEAPPRRSWSLLLIGLLAAVVVAALYGDRIVEVLDAPQGRTGSAEVSHADAGRPPTPPRDTAPSEARASSLAHGDRPNADAEPPPEGEAAAARGADAPPAVDGGDAPEGTPPTNPPTPGADPAIPATVSTTSEAASVGASKQDAPPKRGRGRRPQSVESAIARIRYNALAKCGGSLGGVVSFSFVVDGRSAASLNQVSATEPEPVVSCVRNLIEAARFPQGPHPQQTVTVRF